MVDFGLSGYGYLELADLSTALAHAPEKTSILQEPPSSTRARLIRAAREARLRRYEENSLSSPNRFLPM